MRGQKLFLLAFLLISGCVALPPHTNELVLYAYPETSTTLLGRSASDFYSRNKIDRSQSGLSLIQNAADAYIARITLVRLAEKSLDLQYYLYHDDQTGSFLFNELWKAAERGVRIRLLLDDMDVHRNDSNLALLAQHPNINIKTFNPFDRKYFKGIQYVTKFGKVTRRMHNKLFIADNQFAILGGRNIGDEYFGADSDKAFVDLDVAIIGNKVKEASYAYDLYWNHQLSYTPEELNIRTPQLNINETGEQLNSYAKSIKSSNFEEALSKSTLPIKIASNNISFVIAETEVLYDHPNKIINEDNQNKLLTKLIPYLSNIEKELILITPYFIPGEEGVEFLKTLALRGITVKILTNSYASTDVPLVHAAYANYRKTLVESGVEIYELAVANGISKKQHSKSGRSNSSLHAKYFSVDEKNIFIGSFNFDPRSANQNTEIGIMIKSEVVVKKMLRSFNQLIEKDSYKLKIINGDLNWSKLIKGKEVLLDTEPNTTVFDRLYIKVMSKLPIESQL